MDHEDEYNLDDCYEMDNPNLYVTLATSGQGGYILAESGGLILLETEEPLFR
jgi:hypothetical protein